MTHKEFVTSLYPVAHVHKYSYGYYVLKLEGSDPWSGASPVSEDRAWEMGRWEIERRMLEQLET